MFAACAALGVLLSDVPLRTDDLSYLLWGVEHHDEPLAWVTGTWSPHWRPLNGLVWWLSSATGIDGVLARVVQVAMWAGTVAFVGEVAWRRAGAQAAAAGIAMLLFNQVFLDLLAWRSWLTTTGTLLGLAIALDLALRDRPLLSAIAGAFALGFKETGAFVSGAHLTTRARFGWILAGVPLLVGASLAGQGATYKLGVSWFGRNVSEHLHGLGDMPWALPLLTAVALPTAPAWAVAATVAAVLLPKKLVGLAVVLTGLAAVRRHPSWLVALVMAWGVPLFGSHAARQYMLEGWLVLACYLAWVRPPRLSYAVWALVLVASLPSAKDYWGPRRAGWQAAAEQRRFLETFDPAPAQTLYPSSDKYELDVDALVWVQRGARFQWIRPTEGEPVQVGPLSGVWADLRPSEPEGAGQQEDRP